MKKILFLAVVAAMFTVPIWAQKSATAGKGAIAKQAAAPDASAALTEEFSFLIENFKMNHQGELNNLNVKVCLWYESGISNTDYPDFLAVAKDIEEFLHTYPNKSDYWEIVNKNLTAMVLKKYAMLETIESEIKVSPSANVAYTRSSSTTRRQTERKATKK
jgi:hypothetical protein